MPDSRHQPGPVAPGPSLPQRTLLIVLRVAIGWHFLYEGVTKVLDGGWSSAGALAVTQGPLAGVFREMSSHWRLLDVVDVGMSWGLTVIGLALVLGLFTRLATLSAAFLLGLFYLMNPPLPGFEFVPGEGAYLVVNKNLVELLALLVLWAFPTGRWAGLDRILVRRWGRAVVRRSAAAAAKTPGPRLEDAA